MLNLDAGEVNQEETGIELIRDAFNRGYEKGYKKGQRDEIQAVAQAASDRDLYDWKREIRKF